METAQVFSLPDGRQLGFSVVGEVMFFAAFFQQVKLFLVGHPVLLDLYIPFGSFSVINPQTVRSNDIMF